jgi:hypothetical protein
VNETGRRACNVGNEVKRLTKPSFPRAFGDFSATGHVVTAFTTDADAEKARQTLLRNGFGEEDVTHYNKEEVLLEYVRTEIDDFDPVEIGREAPKFVEYAELAGQGCGFLVVHTPEDEVAKRAVHIVMPFGLTFAEKYKRWTLEDIT